jgi:hypothetical protein
MYLGFRKLTFSSWCLQIHYDRVGKDGLFSHKEVTVLFVPDLSECLPSLDAWRDQWLAHKKAVAERERQLSLKKEVCYIFWNFCFSVSHMLRFFVRRHLIHTQAGDKHKICACFCLHIIVLTVW